MKLNYKRTILVGFAFFLISVFWQAYDATIPVILTNKFGMSQTWSGVIMALDNVLAVILLPIFGAISDKCRSRYGKRTPFITIGTIIAAIAIIALSFVDNAQLKALGDAGTIDDVKGLSVVYNDQKDAQLITPEGEKFVLSEKFTEDEFIDLTCKVEVVSTGNIKKILKDHNILPAMEEGKAFVLSQDFSEGAFDAYLAQVKSEADAKLLKTIYDMDVPVHVFMNETYILTEGLSQEAVGALALIEGSKVENITHPYYINYVAPAR